jgi:hypothetical protein
MTACKYQGNPLKNMIFNKNEGVDPMQTHNLYRIRDHPRHLFEIIEVYAGQDPRVPEGQTVQLGKLLSSSLVYEGVIENLQPNGFGRVIWKDGSKVHTMVAMFRNGIPCGSAVVFAESKLEPTSQGYVIEDNLDYDQKIPSLLHYIKILSGLKLKEEQVKHFGGQDVAKTVVTIKQSSGENEE